MPDLDEAHDMLQSGVTGPERRIAASTAKCYQRCVAALHSQQRCRQRLGSGESDQAAVALTTSDVSPVALLLELAIKDLKPRSVATYRAGLIWYLNQPADARLLVRDDPVEIDIALETLAKCARSSEIPARLEKFHPALYAEAQCRISNGAQRIGTKTKGKMQRAKRFIKDEDHKFLNKMLLAMHAAIPSKGRDPLGARLFLAAVIACGGRPAEVMDVEWSDRDEVQVRLKTQKSRVGIQHHSAKQGATGLFESPKVIATAARKYIVVPSDEVESRLVLLKNRHDINAVRKWIDYRDAMCSSRECSAWAILYGRMKTALRHANRLCFNEIRYNFYSGRHQFAADSKWVSPIEEVGRELGHKEGSSVARKNYGKRKHARTAVKLAHTQRQQSALQPSSSTAAGGGEAAVEADIQAMPTPNTSIDDAGLPPAQDLGPMDDAAPDGDFGEEPERPRFRG